MAHYMRWHPIMISSAAEAQVLSGRVWRVLTASCTPVAVAVILVAHERTALLDFVCACLWTLRVPMHCQGVVPDGPPVIGPLPNVADHVLQAEGIGHVPSDWVGSSVAILGSVFVGKSPSPDVAPHLTA